MYFSPEIIYSPPQGLREKNMIIWRKHLEIELGFIYLSRNIKGSLHHLIFQIQASISKYPASTLEH